MHFIEILRARCIACLAGNSAFAFEWTLILFILQMNWSPERVVINMDTNVVEQYHIRITFSKGSSLRMDIAYLSKEHFVDALLVPAWNWVTFWAIETHIKNTARENHTLHVQIIFKGVDNRVTLAVPIWPECRLSMAVGTQVWGKGTSISKRIQSRFCFEKKIDILLMSLISELITRSSRNQPVQLIQTRLVSPGGVHWLFFLNLNAFLLIKLRAQTNWVTVKSRCMYQVHLSVSHFPQISLEMQQL